MTQPIGSVIPGILERAKEQHAVLQAIQQGWGALVGKRLATHTQPVSFRRGRLVVHVDQPGDSFMLSYQRIALLKRLQAVVKQPVTELVIRAGELRRT